MGQRSDEVADARSLDQQEGDGAYDATSMAAGAGYSGSLAGMPYSEGDPELYTEQVEVGAGYSTLDEGDDDGSDEIDETRSRIEETRNHLSGTIDAIQEKLSPGHMVQEAKDTVREATIGKAQDVMGSATDTARGYGSSVVDAIRQNPIPAALAGVGLGWLFVSLRKGGNGSSGQYSQYAYRPDTGYDQYGYTRNRDWDDQYRADGYGTNEQSQGVMDRAGDMAGQAQSAMTNAAGTVQDTANQAMGRVQNTAGQAMDQMQSTAGELAHSAQSGMVQARSGFQRMMDSSPLAVGVMALGAGAAIGLAIPETEMENELMGEQRDQLVDQAQSKAQGMAQRAQTVAQEAVGAARDAAKQEAESQGLTGSNSSETSI